MANVNKTVAERLREMANGKSQYPGCELLVSAATGSAKCRQDANTCTECKGKSLKDLADMIEAEQAELRERVDECNNTFIDLAALDLLCDKLECGDANHRATAEQIRKAMKGVKPQLPEGVEWPRFTDGELVKFGDKFIDVHGYEATAKMIIFGAEGFVFNAGYSSKCCRNYGEPVKRPEPEVLDADGVPIKVGDTVYTEKGEKLFVQGIERNFFDDDTEPEHLVWCGEYVRNGYPLHHLAKDLTHRKPDTLESVVTEMLAEWDENNEEFLDMDSYFARFRKLIGGE